MLAFIVDTTERKVICSIFVLDIASRPTGAEFYLSLNKKRYAFKVTEHAEGVCILKKINSVSKCYCPDKVYKAFIDEICDWDKFYSLVKQTED